MRNKAWIVGALLAVGMAQAGASDRLINVDGPGISPTGGWRLSMGATLHRGQEDRTYTSFDGRMGLVAGWELGFRGTFAPVGRANTVASLRSGGTDWELFGRHELTHLKGLTVQGGVAFPNTPAQDKPFVTLGASYQLPNPSSEFKVFVGIRGALRSGSTVVGVSGGVVAPMGQGLEFVGDVTGVVRGVNSRDGRTGNVIRNAVYGVGLRYSPAQSRAEFDWNFYVGISNALGMTTATSLSSALGNRPALTFGVVLRGKP